MPRLVATLLDGLASPHLTAPRETLEAAAFMPLQLALGDRRHRRHPRRHARPRRAPFRHWLNVWDRLDDWPDEASAPARQPRAGRGRRGTGLPERPARLRGRGAPAADGLLRRGSRRAFAPRDSRAENHIVLAEAGTGLGKTLGYLAPAWLWARRNAAPVWISTYTKNLQRQLDQESRPPRPRPGRAPPPHRGAQGPRELSLPAEPARRRAGRPVAGSPRGRPLPRWSRAGRASSRDGDMVGGDFPAWLLTLAGWAGRQPDGCSPTGAANASMRPAPITANASSSAP